MIVRDIGLRERGDRVRVGAEIVYEDSDRRGGELFYETERATAEGFVASADPFLLAGYAFAAAHGEGRLRVEGAPACPLLASTIPLLFRSFREASPGLRRPALDLPEGTAAAFPRDGAVAATYLSGGVDAIAMLLRQTAALPPGHPDRFAEALLVFGFSGMEVPADDPAPERVEAFRGLRARMDALAASRGVRLVTATTNVRDFVDDYGTWSDFVYPPAHASVAHAFRGRWTSVHMASAGEFRGGAWDPGSGVPAVFESSALAFRTDDPRRSRTERVREVAACPEALAVVQPCHQVEIPADGRPNCGRCEKCVRTMIALLLLGKLEAAAGFPSSLEPETIERVWVGRHPAKLALLEEQIAPLARAGRRDLARALRRRTRRLRRSIRRRSS